MQEDDQARILVLVADAVESLGPCRAEGVFLAGKWQVARFRGLVPDSADLTAAFRSPGGVQVRHEDAAWTWAYPMALRHASAGCLVVSAPVEPAESECDVIVLAEREADL
jgi:hypothetical protein